MQAGYGPRAMARPPTIGIDARAAAEVPAGRGRYVRELLTALARTGDEVRFVLYARERWQAELDERFTWRLVEAPDPIWHLRVARAASGESDVFLSTNSYLTAWFLRVPSVVVVYDLVAFDRALRPQRRAALIERATIRPAIRRAARLLAISEATRRDLVARFPRAADKAIVTPLAADTAFSAAPEPSDAGVLERHGIDGPYVLATGTLEPRKNLPRLIRAFDALDPGVRERRRLVIVGPTGWETGETEQAIAEHGDLVVTVGRVPDADLPALYRRADVFCYPSIYEGFGLPVLEAMQCGTAVVTSDVSSLPEVGGDAVRYVEPSDTGSIRDGLAAVLSDPALRARLAAAGVERARGFSWDRTARMTLDALLDAMPARARAS